LYAGFLGFCSPILHKIVYGEDNVRRGISNKVTPPSFLFGSFFLTIIEIVLYYIYDFSP
jgi:hypothetical protein